MHPWRVPFANGFAGNCLRGSLIVGLIVCGFGPAYASSPVIVSGKGLTIEQQELEFLLQSEVRRAKIRGSDLSAVHQQGLEELLEKKLLRLEVQRLGLMDSVQAKVEAEMAAFKKNYATEAARKAFYLNAGVTEEMLRQRYEEVAVLRRVEKEVGIRKPSLEVSKRQEPPEKAEVRDLATISVLSIAKAGQNSVPSNDDRQALATNLAIKWGTNPELVRREIGKANWKDLIKLSAYRRMKPATLPKEGGKNGESKFEPVIGSSEPLPQEVRAEAEKLKPGETSGVVSTASAFYVLRASAPEKPPESRKLQFAKEQKEKWEAYINELKKRYEVKIVAQPD